MLWLNVQIRRFIIVCNAAKLNATEDGLMKSQITRRVTSNNTNTQMVLRTRPLSTTDWAEKDKRHDGLACSPRQASISNLLTDWLTQQNDARGRAVADALALLVVVAALQDTQTHMFCAQVHETHTYYSIYHIWWQKLGAQTTRGAFVLSVLFDTQP